MTYAELLRKYATDATNEGGMWFSGEYMTVLASIAESIEAENTKLRELLVELYELTDIADVLGPNVIEWNSRMADIEHGMRELGIEVPR